MNRTQKLALITGITGQDGSYLAEFLLSKGYRIFGIVRRVSTFNTKRIDHIFNKLKIYHGDLTDIGSLITALQDIKILTDGAEGIEIYNLAAQSHVRVSFDIPIYTDMVNSQGVLNLLEAIRMCNLINTCKLYQASTSELFGKVKEIPQNEHTPFYPRSPYGVSKLCAYWYIQNYKEAYGLFGCNGILFNHESPRRGETFVTRKVTLGIADIVAGRKNIIYLGNLDAQRDWSHAKDCVRSMYLILQQNEPDDYVIGSGETHTIREFIEIAFKVVDITIKWRFHGIHEEGYDAKTNKIHIKINKQYFRPTEVDILLSDPSYAVQKINWLPEYTFEELVEEMVKSDLD
jgi:GDPmannose 4,6-dehydratase